MSELYNKIDNLCKSKKINITNMCKYAGVSRSALTDLKAERSKSLSVDTLTKISKFFDVPLEFFIDDENKKITPAENGRDDINEDLQKLSEGDRQYVKGIIQGLLAKNGLDE